MRKRFAQLLLIVCLTVIVAVMATVSLKFFMDPDAELYALIDEIAKGKPANFKLIVPKDWELEIGDSRTVDYSFYTGTVDRKLTWTTTSKSIATVDKWGRVTARGKGKALVIAENGEGARAAAILNVVTKPTKFNQSIRKIDYNGNAVSLGVNLQKIVTRYETGNPAIPASVSTITDYPGYQTAITQDGAVWEITDYGVLRTYDDAANPRDKEQRFMGDRYFYSADTTNGKVLAIVADGADGIWTIMEDGVTHIEMLDIGGIEKAYMMSENTDTYVSRRGMVAEANYINGEWVPSETDNDGLWTAMYGAGELMRYGYLKSSGTATAAELAAAKRSATIAAEAVLLLSNICMRKGEVEAYVRYQPNGRFDTYNGRWLSEVALKEGGDPSLNIPDESPAGAFLKAYEKYLETGEYSYFLTEEYLEPYTSADWADPRTEDGEYETVTRNLEGYISRTYFFKEEGHDVHGYMYWTVNGDGTATGTSSISEDGFGYYMNGENMRGKKVDASGDIPKRLWDDLIGEGYTVEDIVYKGDTSSDELIGHLFIYKLAYDILGPEDPELKQIIANTMDKLAQHVSDNSYMMVDGTGQPGTWSKFNRQFFYNSSQMGGAPLTASVVLSLFKLAAYVTGNQKWENEYRMAALDPSYEYAKIMTQYAEQIQMLMLLFAKDFNPLLEFMVKGNLDSPLSEMLTRLFLNYSDEEMAMLSFYLLFQMESDEQLLGYYREAIDDWWISMKYSENPLWYYIYQLAYPGREIKDAYGNNILETAAWSLSRHPIDTRRYLASNRERDDIAVFSLSDYGIDGGSALSFSLENGNPLSGNTGGGEINLAAILQLLGTAPYLQWAVAAPDERSLHKYNNSSYDLHGNHNINRMEGATTYTLPFWMGCYHGMLKVG